jgi:hypothetical protein
MPASRVYVVKDGKNHARLVEATHPSNALRHVAEDVFEVAIPTQSELIALTKAGVEVEQIGAEQQKLEAQP